MGGGKRLWAHRSRRGPLQALGLESDLGVGGRVWSIPDLELPRGLGRGRAVWPGQGSRWRVKGAAQGCSLVFMNGAHPALSGITHDVEGRRSQSEASTGYLFSQGRTDRSIVISWRAGGRARGARLKCFCKQLQSCARISTPGQGAGV